MTDPQLSTIVSLLDLTALGSDENEDTIKRLCQRAITPLGKVAAVCVYGQFIPMAADWLAGTEVQIATVCNFPSGEQPLEETLTEIASAIELGATEIDLVMPYHLLLAGKAHAVQEYLARCKSLCEEHILKVILETGALQRSEIIQLACHTALDAGADFLKTSTGKHPIGATLEAAQVMLSVIRASDFDPGLKISGGVRTLEQAKNYLALAQEMMGESWIDSEHFRIGASQLLEDIIRK